MRPIYLECNAFGPFADKVVFPLEQISGGVFLIHGATGAGKTTIFDAICFALFGSASGEYRQVDSFRSDFASDDIKTSVILKFSHNGNVYEIHRSPAYRRKKQRGEGYTDSKAEATLFMPDGSIIVGYQVVTEKIEEILAINWKQFKQISMIAQGEFLKLLTVESKERGEIFRKVFHTGNLERIGKQLKEKMLVVKRACDEGQRSFMQYCQSIECPSEHEYAMQLKTTMENKGTLDTKEVLMILHNLIQMDRKEKEVFEEQLAILEKNLTELQLKKAKQQQLKQKKEEWISLEEQLPQMLLLQQKKEEEQKRLCLARNADSFVRSSLELYQSAVKATKELTNSIQEKKEQVEALAKQKEIVELVYKEAQAEKELINQLVATIEQLKMEQVKLQEKEEYEKQYKKKENEVVVLLKQVKQQQNDVEQKEEQIKQCRQKIEMLPDIVQRKMQLEQKKEELKQKIEQWNIWKQQVENYVKSRNDYKRLVERLEESLQKQQKDMAKLQELEAMYIYEQAGILASKLEEGMPCPVCGSLSHPELAKASDLVLSKEQLEEKRKECEVARKKVEELGKEVASQKAKMEALVSQLGLTEGDSIEQIVAEREQLKCLQTKELYEVEKQSDSLVKQEKEAIKAKEEESRLEEKQKEEKLQLQQLEKQYQVVKTEQETLHYTIQKMEKEVIYKTLLEVKEALKSVETEQQCKKQKIVVAEQNYQDWKEKNQRESAVLEQLLGQQLVYLQKEEKAYQTYKEDIFLAGFSNEIEYKQAVLSKEQQDKIEKEIKEIEHNWIHYEKKKALLEQELKEEKGIDSESILEDIIILLQEKEDEKRQYTEQYTNQVARLQQNEKLLEQMMQQNEKQEQLQKEYSEIAILSQVANGELAGKEKLPFEQYVQAFYFEQVIAEANVRLRQMSGGRYALARRKEAENKRSVTGLDLEVMDYFTGKTRGVKSLSGGETFKAALSLALGLSDVIQKYAGGIVVETMFIDEGFGSLDKDSLEQALSILKDLATGNRMVGIISHVEELKECIEKKIVVTKDIYGKGSTIKMQL